MRIRVKGSECPFPITSFNEIPVEEDQKQTKKILLRNIEKSSIFIFILYYYYFE